ncbi:MAG TPA: NAD(P)/FAD-dependent oxidoreductase [Gemmatimonadaceae bacterium]|nr:NAD(P)/FAD-dependent oxidoreductase [Gemmatimonadaceae bacterium]
MSADRPYDVAIVGGGPAGLAAAIFLGRYLHRVALVDSGDPRHWETRHINGYLGLPEIRPAELRGRGRDECRNYDVELIDGCVTRVRKESADRFVVEYDPLLITKAELDVRGPGATRSDPHDNAPGPANQRLTARRLLLAFGLKDEWPKVPGLQQVYGATAHVCPDCDGWDIRGKKVLVIAAGRKAAGMALNLTAWTREIVICTNGEPPGLDEEQCAKLDALNIPLLTAPIQRIHPNGDQIHSVEIDGGMQLDCDHIFFALSQRPADDLGAQLGCERDDEGQIIVDDVGHTSVYNVFAAGDIVPGSQLALVAAAEGARAALAIHKSLVPPERKLDKPKPDARQAEPKGELLQTGVGASD